MLKYRRAVSCLAVRGAWLAREALWYREVRKTYGADVETVWVQSGANGLSFGDYLVIIA